MRTTSLQKECGSGLAAIATQTAITFVFTGFLETSFHPPLNVPLSLQAYIR